MTARAYHDDDPPPAHVQQSREMTALRYRLDELERTCARLVRRVSDLEGRTNV